MAHAPSRRRAQTGSTVLEYRAFEALARGSAALQGAAPPPPSKASVPAAPLAGNDDGEVMVRLKSVLERDAAALATQRTQARVWAAQAAAMEASVRDRNWPRWQLQERARMQREVVRLRAQARCVVVDAVAAHARRQRRLEELQRMWALTQGSGRRAPRGGWVMALHGGQTQDELKLKDPSTRKRHEEVDTQELLGFLVTQTLHAKQSGLMLSNGASCPRCFTPMQAARDSQLQCTKCRMVFDSSLIVSSSMLEGGGDGLNASKTRCRGRCGQYKTSQHFMARVLRVQVQQGHHVSPQTYLDLCAYVHKFKIPRHDWTNVWVGREMLMATGNHKLYEYVQLVLMTMSGVRPPQLPPVLQNEFSILIRMIHRVWKELQRLLDDEMAEQEKLAGRSVFRRVRNSPNVGFCFDHIATLLGHPELCKWNWSIWEPSNVASKDALFQLICLIFDWQFTPTKVPRMAGPAKVAVQARVRAWAQAEMVLDTHDWRDSTPAERAEQTAWAKTHDGALYRPTRGKQCQGSNRALALRVGAAVWEEHAMWPVRVVMYYDYALSDHNLFREDAARTEAAEAWATTHGARHIAELVREQRGLYGEGGTLVAGADGSVTRRPRKRRRRGKK
jgi:hypothetical protein